jgi:hypothetical protein
MKKYGIKYLVLAVFLVSALFIVSCDSSDDSTPTGTITMTIGTDDEVTFSGSADGVMAAQAETGGGPIPTGWIGVAAIDETDPELSIAFVGTTAGTYTIEGGTAIFSCSDADGNIYAAMQGLLPHTSGSVVVTEVGAVGEMVTGTYSISADPWVGGVPSGTTITISGSFEALRFPNEL